VHYALQQQLALPGEVVPPQLSEIQIPGLATYSGWRCQHCPYLCTSEASMAKHSQLKHKWVKARGIEWDPTTLQTFFGGAHRRFFQVAEQPPTTLQQDKELPLDLDTAIAALLEKGEQQDHEEAEQAFQVNGERQLAVDNTPWMRKTRWATKFLGKDIRAVSARSSKPSLDEGSLKLVWDSVLRVFRHCQASIASWHRDEEDGDLVLG
jgi:hypothetical protein